MRLKQNRVRQYYHRQSISKKDNEGGSYLEYAPALSFRAEMWAGGGKMQSEIYGIRLPNIRNMRVEGDYAEVIIPNNKVAYQVQGGPLFTINDGICIYSEAEAEPDYKIVAIYPYRYLTLEVEKI